MLRWLPGSELLLQLLMQPSPLALTSMNPLAMEHPPPQHCILSINQKTIIPRTISTVLDRTYRLQVNQLFVPERACSTSMKLMCQPPPPPTSQSSYIPPLWEVLGSVLGGRTYYPNGELPQYSSVPPTEMLGYWLCYATTASFQTISGVPFIQRPVLPV
jgi:hypothetical protein